MIHKILIDALDPNDNSSWEEESIVVMREGGIAELKYKHAISGMRFDFDDLVKAFEALE